MSGASAGDKSHRSFDKQSVNGFTPTASARQTIMLWLLRDFDLLSVVLRAVFLALEALTLGGFLFLLMVAIPGGANPDQLRRSRRTLLVFALYLAATQIAIIALSAIELIGSAQVPWQSIVTAGFFEAGCVEVASCCLLAALINLKLRASSYLALLPAFGVLGASVAQSHAEARLTHRELLLAFTALHHLGVAGWIGAMLFLLLALRKAPTFVAAQALARYYSGLALFSVPVLILAGVGMSLSYVGSWQGLYGTSYGVLLIAKTCLMCGMLLLGATNMQLVRLHTQRGPAGGQQAGEAGVAGRGFLRRLRRLGEAELGLGFTAVLAAASMTSQPPAVDLPHDQLRGRQIVQRMHWVAPRFSTPAFSQLAPPSSLAVSVQDAAFRDGTYSDATDRAWSEYNHHWAGLLVLFTGVFALAGGLLPEGRSRRLAQNWPLLFLGLSAFILLRADPECWPLGPRPFWASFTAPDVLEHRLYAVLAACFALFEWGVATGHLRWRRAAYVFPLIFAGGGAALLTHSHGLSNIQDETLADISHTGIAVLGAAAGWSRWLELRLPSSRIARYARVFWPVCLVLVGLLLLDYRES
jgi:putative copper resistance protein D